MPHLETTHHCASSELEKLFIALSAMERIQVGAEGAEVITVKATYGWT